MNYVYFTERFLSIKISFLSTQIHVDSKDTFIKTSDCDLLEKYVGHAVLKDDIKVL